MAKQPPIDMGNYMPNKHEQLAYSWCINNGIYISPKSATTSTWHLLIDINKKINISPNVYKKIEIWEQLYKFYSYYYNKYAIKVKVETVKEPKEKLIKQQQKENNDNNLKLF